MKTKTIISEITHDDLVDLLSTALTGSYIFGCDYDMSDYRKLENPSDNDSIEDKLARLLLAGKTIIIFDTLAECEEDFYGSLWHTFDGEHNTMDYMVSLKDIKNGLQKCIDGTFKKTIGCETEEESYMRRCMVNFMNPESGDFDQPQAESIMQVIIFGGLIYG